MLHDQNELAQTLKTRNIEYFNLRFESEKKWNREPLFGVELNQIIDYFDIRSIQELTSLDLYHSYLYKYPKGAITYHILEYVVSSVFVEFGTKDLSSIAQLYIEDYFVQLKDNIGLCKYVTHFYKLVKSFPVIESYMLENHFDEWNSLLKDVEKIKPNVITLDKKIKKNKSIVQEETSVDNKYGQSRTKVQKSNDMTSKEIVAEVTFSENDTHITDRVIYDDFENFNETIKQILTTLNYQNKEDLKKKFQLLKEMIQKAEMIAEFNHERNDLLLIDDYTDENSKQRLLSFIKKYENAK